MKPQFVRSALGLCIGVLLASVTLKAQTSQTTINYGAPVVVNFQQLAKYELSNPGKVQRSIEQGEDKDKDFKFKPHKVPSDAITFPVNVSSISTRTTSPSTTVSFNGVMDHDSLIPPDIEIAAGTNYVVETTNQQFSIYTKAGAFVNRITINSLFTPTGGSGYFDPHVVYDASNGRFIVASDGNYSNGDGGVFLAISQTNDPTGNWYVYSFDGIGNTSDFLDYPMLGFNTNWVVVTCNDFIGGSSPVYAKIFVLNKASLYSGTEGTLTSVTDQTSYSICPAQTNDASQTTEYLVEDYNGNSGGSGYVRLSTVTGAASSPAYAVGKTLGVTNPWSETAVNAKQLGNSNAINTDDTRISFAVVTGGSMWFSHTVFLPSTKPTYSGVDWYQINPATPSVTQYGRLATSGTFNYYPCINVNSNGDALLGYSVSSTTQYAGAAYAFHAAADAANTMESGIVYKAGVAGYYKTYGGGRNRWGDFSGTAVDPVDNSFWNANEWASTSNNWGTQIANVAASSTCTVASGETTSSISTNSATFSWNAVTGASSYNVQYRVVGTSTWSTSSTTSNTYNAINLTSGSNYEWQVQTVCTAGGSSTFSSSTDFTTSTPPCSVPTGMNTRSINNTGATLDWTAVSGASSYNVEYEVVGASSWTTASVTSPFDSIVGALTPGTNYTWQVQTVCTDGGTSAYSTATNFTTTGTPPCSIPTGMATNSITSTAASLTWTAVTGAASYNLQYRVVGTTTWSTASTTTIPYALSGLTASTNYEWQVQTVCSAGGSSSFTSSTDFTTAASITYCTSSGTSTSEYIHNVTYGTINNTVSNDGGYGNYTNLSTNITAGTATKISVTPAFKSTTYTEDWSIFVDYTHTGTFTIIAEGKGTGTLSGSITIPSTAVNGATRLRIIMHRSTYGTSACTTFTNGDVQDYTVNITGGTGSPALNQDANFTANLTPDNSVQSATLYPNPTNNIVTVHYNAISTSELKVEVISVTGQIMITTTPAVNTQDVQLDVSNLASGLYFIRTITNNGNVITNKLVKE